jgi:hypothetical protein
MLCLVYECRQYITIVFLCGKLIVMFAELSKIFCNPYRTSPVLEELPLGSLQRDSWRSRFDLHKGGEEETVIEPRFFPDMAMTPARLSNMNLLRREWRSKFEVHIPLAERNGVDKSLAGTKHRFTDKTDEPQNLSRQFGPWFEEGEFSLNVKAR